MSAHYPLVCLLDFRAGIDGRWSTSKAKATHWLASIVEPQLQA
jgi:hypothetical protein